MSLRRGHSDSKLIRSLNKEQDEENLDNFLPKFLLKGINSKDEQKFFNEEMETNSEIYNSKFEEYNLKGYMQNLSAKENIEPPNNIKGDVKMKIPRSKFHSSGDLKKFASEQKKIIFNQLQSELQNQLNRNLNISYNINQNINPNFGQAYIQGKRTSCFNPNKSEISNFNVQCYSPQSINMYSCSPNDSGNFSLGEEGNIPKLGTKKANSSLNLDVSKKSANKIKSSLFLCSEKEEKAEDFADLEELLDNISIPLWEYAKTQRGSRNLQKLLNSIQPEGLNSILELLKNNIHELMIDTYGNYFCQKLIQSCSGEQRIIILKHIMNEFTEISCNSSGTHALQTLIEIINMPGEVELVIESVKENFLKLSYDNNATHVIQKLLSCIAEENRTFINKTILDNLQKLLFDPNGICIIKKFINGNKDNKMRNYLLKEISNNALEIVQNSFGNYVIQHILDEWGPVIAKDIIEKIISAIVSLSMQKFSSNVVEKCFDIVDMYVRKKMVKELFNTGKISSLLKNKYGNFVLQKAVHVMTIEEKIEIKEYLGKKLSFTSNKEKARLKELIDII